MAQTFIPSTLEANLCEFNAILVYSESSRTARTTQGNPISEEKNQTSKSKIKKKDRERTEGRRVWWQLIILIFGGNISSLR